MSSWIDTVRTLMVIRTGDGKEYTPRWFRTQYNVEYNQTLFEFINKTGTLVRRQRPKGPVYDLEIVFDGEFCLDTAEAFKTSANDARGWTLTHPMYGALFVYPVSLRFDNTVLNVVKITGQLIESNEKTVTGTDVSLPDVLQGYVALTDKRLVDTYAEQVPEMQVSDLQRLQQHINDTYNTVSIRINDVQANVDDYLDAYNAANAVLNTALFDTGQIIGQALTLIRTPATFQALLQIRLEMLQLQMSIYRNDIAAINSLYNTPTASLKRLFENNAAQVVTAICIATITNITNEYVYRPNILTVIAQVLRTYNTYIDDLCDLQTENNGEPDSYVPDPDSIRGVYDSVMTSVRILYNLAAGAQQQRVYTVPYDTTLINLADLLYGNTTDDAAIQKILDTNELSYNELIIIPQGREILYYI